MDGHRVSLLNVLACVYAHMCDVGVGSEVLDHAADIAFERFLHFTHYGNYFMEAANLLFLTV